MVGGKCCCVPFCAATKAKCRGLSFHRFPKDKKMIKEWLIKIRRDVGPTFQLRPWTTVWSRHFTMESFRENSHGDTFIRHLKADAIPTKSDWNDWGELKKRKEPSIRAPSGLINHKTEGNVPEKSNELDEHMSNTMLTAEVKPLKEME